MVVFVSIVLPSVAGTAPVFFAVSVAEGIALLVDEEESRAVCCMIDTVDRAGVVRALLVVEVVRPGAARGISRTDGPVETLGLPDELPAGRFKVPSAPVPPFFGCTRLLPCGVAWEAVLLPVSFGRGFLVPFNAGFASNSVLLDCPTVAILNSSWLTLIGQPSAEDGAGRG